LWAKVRSICDGAIENCCTGDLAFVIKRDMGRQDDLDDVRRKLRELATDGRVDELIEMVVMLLAQVRDDNTALHARLHAALRALYGRKSEKVPAGQLALLFENLGDGAPHSAQQIADEAKKENEEQERRPPRKVRKRKKGKGLPDDLPREAAVLEVPEHLRTCQHCGSLKQTIGWAMAEVLEFVPAHFKYIDEQREKIACKKCGNGVVVAAGQKPLDRGRPGPGLLAHVAVSKCQDSLPLYRQCQIYERAGVHISSSTIGDWFGFTAVVLEPIAKRIAERVLESFVIRADDTGIRVLDPRHPNGVKLGHMWGYVGNGAMVAFDYTPTWEAKGPLRFLQGFTGYLQGDGYAGFKSGLTRADGVPLVPEEKRLGCGMHIRRKFEPPTKGGDARAAIALAYFRRIYDIERSCKEDQLDFDQRKVRRDELSLPIVDELYGWVHSVHRNLIPGDQLYKATLYATNQEAVWRRCFSDGRFEIDNGEVERQLRRIAIGRKNYLFAGSDNGAHRLATLYTVLGTCHMHGVDPLAYLTDVIAKLQNDWPMSRLDELLPDAWTPPPRAAPVARPDASEPAPASAVT
jgi:transposase